MTGRLDLTGRPRLWDQPELGRWRRAAVRAVADVDPSLRAAPCGDLMLRDQLGHLLGVPPAAVAVTSGVRAAAARLTASCDGVVVERPTFLGVVHALRAGGVAVSARGWETMTDGIGPRSGLWFTTPCRNPDGRTADPWLLAALADAVGRGRRVVCNGAYRWFGRTPELPDGVIQVGTLHKLAGAGAGLGWVVGADPALASTLSAPPLHWQRTWARFLADGGIELLLDRQRDLSAARAAFAGAVGLAGDPGAGPNLLVRVPGPEGAAVAALSDAGVLVSPGSAFDAPWPSIRICLAGVSTADAALAAERVRRVLDYRPVKGNRIASLGARNL